MCQTTLASVQKATLERLALRKVTAHLEIVQYTRALMRLSAPVLWIIARLISLQLCWLVRRTSVRMVELVQDMSMIILVIVLPGTVAFSATKVCLGMQLMLLRV